MRSRFRSRPEASKSILWIPSFFPNAAKVISALWFISLAFTSFKTNVQTKRKLSISLPDGNCVWTDALPLGADKEPFGTLLASYPGSGMRVTWQQIEGMTGIQVGDDFHLGGDGAYDKKGIIKTQYPHLEGIWSYGDNLDQTILLLRNPRWAIPSYHTFLYEIHYAHDWETAYEYLHDTFIRRSPQENWQKWRDYRFKDEVDLWMWFIDYYMGNGTQYWTDFDYERNGQWPFSFYNETEKVGKTDLHCVYDLDCFPAAILSYEKLRDPTTGVEQMTMIADVLEGKPMMTVIDRTSIDCVYHETWTHAPFPSNDNRNNNGPTAENAYGFTHEQMLHFNTSLTNLRNQYSTGHWATNQRGIQLVGYLDEYIADISQEIVEMGDPGPTMAPNAQHRRELVQWYTSLGRGNRYDKAKVQALGMYWAKVEHLYEALETLGGNPYEGINTTVEPSAPFVGASSESNVPYEDSILNKLGF